jgi:hypothetical protein
MRTLTAATLIATAVSLEASCSTNDTAPPSGEAGPNLEAGTGEDAGGDAGDDGDAGPASPMVRFAQLSPDAPALDFCLAAHGTGDFQGPLLAQFAEDAGSPLGAGAPGLSFAQVSAYFTIDAGQYDVRLVAAGATSCAPGAPGRDASVGAEAGAIGDASVDADGAASADAGEIADAGISAEAGATADAGETADAGVGADVDAGADSGESAAADGGPMPALNEVTNLPSLAAGTSTTILLVGEVSPSGGDAAFRAVAVQDDTALVSGGASLRTINALPATPNVDFGYGTFASAWSPLFTGVAFGDVSLTAAPSQGRPDANGYLAIAPFGPGAFSVRSSSNPTGDLAASQAASVNSGDVATILAVGGKTGDPAHPPELLLCTDNAPTGDWLGVCGVLP